MLAGLLPEAERAALAHHAATCDRCQALVQGLIETGGKTLPASLAGVPAGTQDRRGSKPRAAPSSSEEFTGTDRFELVRRIGVGGMGVVYEVGDRERLARFALKTLPPLSQHRLSLFKNEFRVLRGLSHRNLVTLGELVKDRDHWFFTMELVEGAPFLSWVCPRAALIEESPTVSDVANHPDWPGIGGATRTRFDEDRLRDGLRQLAAALHALHGRGKVHRDIKPSNVLVTHEGRVVVLDFGLVRDLRGPENDDGLLVGTPAYMAPEQTSHAQVGPEVDWYSVGVMLYAALSGRLPFGGTVHEVLVAKAARLPVPPSALVEEGDEVRVGSCALEVVHLAGHTPGGIALLYRDPEGSPHLFSGDSLFPGGVGNTDRDPERFKSLMTDVETKVFDRLPDDTWVYPGHGNDTTLGAERPSLPEWWARGW